MNKLLLQITSIMFQCACYITQSWTSFIAYSSTSQEKNGFKYPALLIDIFMLKRNIIIIWTCFIGPVTSLSVAFF